MKHTKGEENPPLPRIDCALMLNAFRKFTEDASKLVIPPNTQQKTPKKTPLSGRELFDAVCGIISDATVIFETLQVSYEYNNGKGRKLSIFELGKIGVRALSAGRGCVAVNPKTYLPNVASDMECKLAALYGIVFGEIYKDVVLSQTLMELNDANSELAIDNKNVLYALSSIINLKILFNFTELKQTIKNRVDTYIDGCESTKAEALRAYIKDKDPSFVFIERAVVAPLEEESIVAEIGIVEKHFGPDSELRVALGLRRAYFTVLESSAISYFQTPTFENELIVQKLLDEILKERSPDGHYQFFSSSVKYQDKELYELVTQFQTSFHATVESINQIAAEEQLSLGNVP